MDDIAKEVPYLAESLKVRPLWMVSERWSFACTLGNNKRARARSRPALACAAGARTAYPKLHLQA